LIEASVTPARVHRAYNHNRARHHLDQHATYGVTAFLTEP
jgi:hypothetical protein